VVRAVQRLGSQGPSASPEQDDEEKEEGPDHFEEDDVSDAVERPQESADPARDIGGGFAGGAPRGAHRVRIDGDWPGHCGRGGGRMGCAGGHPLSCHTAGDAQSDPQHPANGLRFHTRL